MQYICGDSRRDVAESSFARKLTQNPELCKGLSSSAGSGSGYSADRLEASLKIQDNAKLIGGGCSKDCGSEEQAPERVSLAAWPLGHGEPVSP